MSTLAASEVFTTGHIAATAAISGALALLAAIALNGHSKTDLLESAIIALLTTAAVFLWRKSANIAPLNTDGLHGFSANDWLAPTLTFVVLSVYRDLRAPRTTNYRRTRAAATIIALAINVITI